MKSQTFLLFLLSSFLIIVESKSLINCDIENNCNIPEDIQYEDNIVQDESTVDYAEFKPIEDSTVYTEYEEITTEDSVDETTLLKRLSTRKFKQQIPHLGAR